MKSGEKIPFLSRRKKALFATLSCVFLLILFEIVLTAAGVGFGWEIEAPMAYEQLRAQVGRTPMWSDEELLCANFSVYRDDRRLLWRLRPDLDLEIPNFLLPRDLRGDRTFRVRTNEFGFRGPPPPPGDDGTGITLCLGGSNTFGWGLDEGEAYPDRLAAILGGGERVVNFGQPGYSSHQGLALWETRGEALTPAWVVLGFGFNDGVKAPMNDTSAGARRRGVIGWTRHTLARTRSYRLFRHTLFSIRPRGKLDADELVPRVPVAVYRRNMDLLVTRIRATGGKPILLSIECKYAKALEKLAADLGVPFVDADAIAEEALLELQNGGGAPLWREKISDSFPGGVLKEDPSWWVKADVAHYNRFVHEKVAQALAEIITK